MKKNKLFLKTAVLLAVLQLLAAPAARAGAPLKINFQGRLAESGLAAEGSKTFVFKIYDASSGGNLVWTSASQALTLTQGVFSAALSAGTPAALSTGTFSGARYVEMIVDGVTLTPRQEMMSAPYALVAQALAPDAVMPPAAIAAGSVNDSHVSLTTAAINSGKFGDDRVYISTGAFYGGFNAADKLVKLDASGRLGVGVAPTSSLTVGGPIALPIMTVDVDYTIGETDSTILVDATNNDIAVTLPDAVTAAGRVYTIKRRGDEFSGYSVDIFAAVGQTIDGFASIFIDQWDSVVLQSDGNNWLRIGGLVN